MTAVQSEDLFQLKGVSQPTKVGSQVFFVETHARKEENDYSSKIVSVNLNNQERKVWGDSGSVNTRFQISPDKTELAYLSNEKDKMQVHVMALSGGAAKAITEEKEGVSRFSWSKDGKSIYYQTVSLPEDGDNDFPQRFTTSDHYYKGDGSGLTPQDATHFVKKVEIESKETNTLIESEYSFILGHVTVDEKSVYVTAANDLDNDKDYSANVYRYDVENKTFDSLLNFDKGYYSFEDINSDETKILYSGNDMTYGIVHFDDLYIFDIESGESTKLTGELDQEVGDVVSGDFQQQVTGIKSQFVTDDKIAFISSHQGTTQLYTVTLSTELEKVLDLENHIYDGTIDGEVITFAYSNPTTPGVVAIFDNGKTNDIYNPNTKYQEEHTIQDPERFWFEGAENRKTQGWYFPPAETKESHPAILYIHGGPQVAYGETFFHEMQVLASLGYGVININPRGSGSYGQMGAYSIVGDYGNNDYNDLMLGVDDVLENHPEIDQDNIFVAGGSYGGFMTNWIVGHNNRFKAAITQRSISNWISFFGTSDIGPFFVKENLKNDLSSPLKLWRMSPLAYVGDVKTPVLVQHSEEDLRCPMEQGEQFYTGLKDRGVDAEFIRYPKSSHGLSREGLPNLRMDRLSDITKWVEKHYG